MDNGRQIITFGFLLVATLPSPSMESTSYEPVENQTRISTSSYGATVLGQFLEREIAVRIERVNSEPWEESTRLDRARQIASAVAEASVEFDVDPFLLVSMIEVESRYNRHALGTHGEHGLMQIKPATALWIAPATDAMRGCDLFTVRCNVRMGARYVSFLQSKTVDRLHILRSYNLGPAKANRLLKEAESRGPDREIAATTEEAPVPAPIPYAVKIAFRADRLRQRYFALAMGEMAPEQLWTKDSVTKIAMNQ